MNWYFINNGFNAGKFNMFFDLYLANSCKVDEAYFRIYRWKPYCISLGANQQINSINKFKAEKENIDIVKRPTGGRAILHSEELTYSMVFPLNSSHPRAGSARNIYQEINLALIEGLKLYDYRLAGVELENNQPDFLNFYKQEESRICFSASAKSEIKFNGKKLIGSAQRKFHNSILQHGSILCGSFHRKIIDYLFLNEKSYLQLKTEMKNKTIDIKSILKEEIDYNLFTYSIAAGFERYFKIKFNNINPENFSEAEILNKKQKLILAG